MTRIAKDQEEQNKYCYYKTMNGNSSMSSGPSINKSSLVDTNPNSMANSNNSNNAEQPQTKRQKIERIKACYSKNIKSSLLESSLPLAPPPDFIDTFSTSPTRETLSSSSTSSPNSHNSSLSLSSSSLAQSASIPNSSNNSASTSPSNSRSASFTKLLLVQHGLSSISQTTPASITSTTTATVTTPVGGSTIEAIMAKEVPMQATSYHSVSGLLLPDLLPLPQGKPKQSSTSHRTSSPALDDIFSAKDMRKFEESLLGKCLCGVSEKMLKKSFQSHYSIDANGQKRVANLAEWSTKKLIQFLSNLQLLFNIYLKQNSMGFVCARIMDVCDALIRNDHNLIDEIIVLAGYSNRYVQFLAGRVLSSFLVIAKQQMDNDWLKKLVNNLFHFERFNYAAIQKMHFSLEIIKRIVEWRDVELHPLDEDEKNRFNQMPDDSSAASEGDGDGDEDEETATSASGLTTNNKSTDHHHQHGYIHFQVQQQPLENNYFAVHYNSADDNRLASTDSRANSASSSYAAVQRRGRLITTPYQHYATHQTFSGRTVKCQLVSLTDSESFDTTHLKCLTIKILENKWPALVKNMSTLIANHLNIDNAENCLLVFLQLWENIISVKANLSIVETLPFYAQLDKFELLLNQSLSSTVYKQMLCLFNEALCYGSTLSLQDMLPDETCLLAHQIVRHVKDFRILESLPRRQPENIVGFIGFKHRAIPYRDSVLSNYTVRQANHDRINEEGDEHDLPFDSEEAIEMDKTILQKMVLLVLKSIAVTVKEIRSDSSDSSIDSTDYDTFQDMVLIERSIRDVFQKLELFIKHTLEFHPECHFSKILIHLFDDQDDHLIEAMLCTLDVTTGISFRDNAFPELVAMLNPVYTFLEFLKMISNSADLLLDLLVSNETCFLLYLLRFLKYMRGNWAMFVRSCYDFGMGASTLDDTMGVLIRLRLQISRLVSRQLYPYDISPILRLLESCESLYDGNEFS